MFAAVTTMLVLPSLPVASVVTVWSKSTAAIALACVGPHQTVTK
jgi:hypothetical protein